MKQRSGQPPRRRWVSARKIRYYRILELRPDASLEELRLAHKDLVKVWHPDRFADDLRLQLKAQEKLKEINQAYEQVLLDFVEAAPRRPAPDFVRAGPQPTDDLRRNAPGPAASVPPPEPPEPFPRRNIMRAALGLGIVVILALGAFALIFNEDIRRQELAPRPNVEASAGSWAPADQSGRGAGDAYFSLGSPEYEVLAVQGTPTSVEEKRWMYGLSSVDFSDGKVENYTNDSGNLRVRLVPKGDYSAARLHGYFTLGSTPDEVLAVQGTPTSVDGQWWRYESSAVGFSGGRVENYANLSRNLHIQVYPTTDVSAARARGYFTLGSNPDEVLAIQGTPASIEGTRWRYESSLVEFSDRKVRNYSNSSQNLHVQVFPSGDVSAARSRGYFTLGSSVDEVLALQGTPTSIDEDRWGYGLSWVKFQDGRVERFANISANLKLQVQ